MMRQTNDCSPVRVMQHKVMYFLYLSPRSTQPLGLRPSGWVDLELCPRVWSNPAPNLGLYSINPLWGPIFPKIIADPMCVAIHNFSKQVPNVQICDM